MDDIAFAAQFPAWCAPDAGGDRYPLVDYQPSLRAWGGDKGLDSLSCRPVKVVFHDTNLREVFTRKDGSEGRGWDNERGVIRSIEDWFGMDFDETKDFVLEKNGWLIRHWRHCNGLMIMDRYF